MSELQLNESDPIVCAFGLDFHANRLESIGVESTPDVRHWERAELFTVIDISVTVYVRQSYGDSIYSVAVAAES